MKSSGKAAASNDRRSDDLEHEGRESSNGASRRAALKAGVGVGVGLVAWSGPTITSLGGTPAYAAGCTFVVRTDLSGGCRNIDVGGDCPFRYHTLVLAGLPPGYTITNPIPEGTCCGPTFMSTLNFPTPGVTCLVSVTLYLKVVADPTGPQCSGTALVERFGPSSDGSLDFGYPCHELVVPPPSVYQISMTCNTTGAPLECLV